MKLRIQFYKIGMIKFISHLDTIRLFSRAMKRAKIPILWSEGYNPHMKMSIAVPLSLGVESDVETMDIEVAEDYNWKKLKDNLNEVLPKGIQITRVTDDFDPRSVFQRLKSTEYDLFFPLNLSPDLEIMEKAIKEFMEKKIVLVSRKRKRGKRRILVDENIRDKVISLNLEKKEDGYTIKAHLCAGAENNLRPDRLLLGLFQFIDQDMDIEMVQIRRRRSFDSDGLELQL